MGVCESQIGCRDITKVPAVVEGVMHMHFFDFMFQREVHVKGMTNAADTTWTRTTNRTSDDFPSPKKTKRALRDFSRVGMRMLGLGTNLKMRDLIGKRSQDNVQSVLVAAPFGNLGKEEVVEIVSHVVREC